MSESSEQTIKVQKKIVKKKPTKSRIPKTVKPKKFYLKRNKHCTECGDVKSNCKTSKHTIITQCMYCGQECPFNSIHMHEGSRCKHHFDEPLENTLKKPNNVVLCCITEKAGRFGDDLVDLYSHALKTMVLDIQTFRIPPGPWQKVLTMIERSSWWNHLKDVMIFFIVMDSSVSDETMDTELYDVVSHNKLMSQVLCEVFFDFPYERHLDKTMITEEGEVLDKSHIMEELEKIKQEKEREKCDQEEHDECDQEERGEEMEEDQDEDEDETDDRPTFDIHYRYEQDNQSFTFLDKLEAIALWFYKVLVKGQFFIGASGYQVFKTPNLLREGMTISKSKDPTHYHFCERQNTYNATRCPCCVGSTLLTRQSCPFCQSMVANLKVHLETCKWSFVSHSTESLAVLISLGESEKMRARLFATELHRRFPKVQITFFHLNHGSFDQLPMLLNRCRICSIPSISTWTQETVNDIPIVSYVFANHDMCKSLNSFDYTSFVLNNSMQTHFSIRVQNVNDMVRVLYKNYQNAGKYLLHVHTNDRSFLESFNLMIDCFVDRENIYDETTRFYSNIVRGSRLSQLNIFCSFLALFMSSDESMLNMFNMCHQLYSKFTRFMSCSLQNKGKFISYDDFCALFKHCNFYVTTTSKEVMPEVEKKMTKVLLPSKKQLLNFVQTHAVDLNLFNVKK